MNNKLKNLIYFRDWENEYNNLLSLTISGGTTTTFGSGCEFTGNAYFNGDTELTFEDGFQIAGTVTFNNLSSLT